MDVNRVEWGQIMDTVATSRIFFEWSLRNLNYKKFNKEIIWPKKKKHYKFFLLTKRRRKNGLIKDKMGIENTKMRVIK